MRTETNYESRGGQGSPHSRNVEPGDDGCFGTRIEGLLLSRFTKLGACLQAGQEINVGGK